MNIRLHATATTTPKSSEVDPGWDRAAVRQYFEQLSSEQCERIEEAVMDMHPAFTLEVERHCPNARIAYDLCHVIAKYSREVVDCVRVDQANALRHDKAAPSLRTDYVLPIPVTCPSSTVTGQGLGRYHY